MKGAREDTGTVVGRRTAGSDSLVLRVRSELARGIAPGQFLNVKIPAAGDDPFLRRPFSVAWTEPEESVLELLIQVRGRGTTILGAAREGDELSLLGPLGRGFPLKAIAASGGADLIGGACGVAPLLLLGQELGRSDVPVRLFVGARSAKLMPEPSILRERFPSIEFATEDGSLGFHGDAIRLFSERIAPGRIACGCGPVGMLEALRRMALERGLTCYLSLETGMACGYGVCKGCVVMSSSGSYVTVCRDGPIFEARELAPLAGDE